MADLLATADPEQRRLMAEECILLNNDDDIIGHASKKDCHLIPGKLHRAFSVFLFNSHGDLLLQKRSQAKVTFPTLWTNTCCSHPLFVDDEMAQPHGIFMAAKRRMEYELGVADPLKYKFLTRIHYKAESDSVWCEHEIDYILFAQQDVPLSVNSNEVSDIEYISPEKLRNWMESEPELFTPWFRLIAAKFLYKWWNTLRMDSIVMLESDDDIYRL